MKTMVRVIVILLLHALLPQMAHTQQGIRTVGIAADDARARFAAGVVEPLIAGDSMAAARYVLRHAAPTADRERLLQQLGRVVAAVRELDDPSITEFGASEGPVLNVRVAVSSASGGPGVAVMVQIEREPSRIAAIGYGMARAAPPAVQFASFDDLDSGLQQRARDGRFSGVVLAARGDDIRFHRAYGLADRSRGVPVRSDTRFNIASLNKFFTGVAVLRLVQEGRLDLDAPIGRYYSGFDPAIGTRVTARQLLQHRSGVGDYLRDPEFWQDPDSYQDLDRLLALIGKRPLEFEPGTDERYSNSGYVLLGGILTAITGRDYHQVIQDWVFTPAAMTHSGPADRNAVPNTAIGYSERLPEAQGTLTATMMVPATPAGGGYSTAQDIFRFARALAANRLLDEKHTDMFLNRYAQGGTRPATFGPMGAVQGANASLRIDLAAGNTVVILSNLDPPSASQLVEPVLQLVGR